MLRPVLLIVILSLVFNSCISDDSVVQPVDQKDLLLGTWINPEHVTGSQYKWKRAASFNENGPGLKFDANGEHINRNSGWCGTPPLSYFNEEGTFTKQNNLLTISLPNSHMNNSTYQIISVDDTFLILEYQ